MWLAQEFVCSVFPCLCSALIIVASWFGAEQSTQINRAGGKRAGIATAGTSGIWSPVFVLVLTDVAVYLTKALTCTTLVLQEFLVREGGEAGNWSCSPLAVSVMRLNQSWPSWITSAWHSSSASSSLGAPNAPLPPLLFTPRSCWAPQTCDLRSGVHVGLLPGKGLVLLHRAASPDPGPAAVCHPDHSKGCPLGRWGCQSCLGKLKSVQSLLSHQLLLCLALLLAFLTWALLALEPLS